MDTHLALLREREEQVAALRLTVAGSRGAAACRAKNLNRLVVVQSLILRLSAGMGRKGKGTRAHDWRDEAGSHDLL